MNIDKVIETLGGVSAVSRYVGVSRQSVSKWTQVPTKHVRMIVEVSDGKLSYEDVLPPPNYDE